MGGLTCAGGIVEPRTSELYLKSGDRLHLVCEQRVDATVDSTSVDKGIVWSKFETRRGVLINGSGYQTIDTSVGDAPYTINQRPADDGGHLLRSELVKNNVARADSGYYRCRVGYGGSSSRIYVMVVDSKSSSGTSQ